MLIRSLALAQIGGIAAMRGALIDDVTLAGLVKQKGRIWLGHSQLAASIRPYPGAADVWRMIARTAFVQLRFSVWLLGGTVAGMMLVWLVPPVAALFGHGAAQVAGLLGWAAAICVAYVPTLRRFQLGVWWAPFLPLVALFYTAATVGSAADHWRGRGVVWKAAALRLRPTSMIEPRLHKWWGGLGGMASFHPILFKLTSPISVEAPSGKDREGREFPGRRADRPRIAAACACVLRFRTQRGRYCR